MKGDYGGGLVHASELMLVMILAVYMQSLITYTHPPLLTPTRRSFTTAIRTRSPFVRPFSLSLTVRNASVDATTMAALDDRPDPGGTEPVTRRSTA